jgi:hypothetical protein
MHSYFLWKVALLLSKFVYFLRQLLLRFVFPFFLLFHEDFFLLKDNTGRAQLFSLSRESSLAAVSLRYQLNDKYFHFFSPYKLTRCIRIHSLRKMGTGTAVQLAPLATHKLAIHSRIGFLVFENRTAGPSGLIE